MNTPRNPIPINQHVRKQTSAARSVVGAYTRLLGTITLFALVTIVFYLVLYYQFKVWQAFIALGFMAAALVIVIPIVFVLILRERAVAAGVALLIGIVFGYGGNELAWSGLTINHLIAGVFLILLAGRVALPRRWDLWVLIAFGYGVYILIVNRIEPFPRYEQSLLPILMLFSLGANVLLVLTLAAQVLIEFQTRAIRTRLLVTLVLLVFIPAVFSGLLGGAMTVQETRNRSIAGLEAIMIHKATAIENWRDSLRMSFQAVAPDENRIEDIQSMVEQYSQGVDTTSMEVYDHLLDQFNRVMQQSDLFEEISLLSPSGTVVFSTSKEKIGANRESLVKRFEQTGLADRLELAITPAHLSVELGRASVVISAPVLNKDERVVAAMIGFADMEILQQILVERSGLGTSGEAYLVYPDRRLLTPSRFGGFGVDSSVLDSSAIQQVMNIGRKDPAYVGKELYTGYRGVSVIGVYRWLPELEIALIVEQEQREAFSGAYQFVFLMVVIMIVALVLAFLVGVYVTNRIVRPLSELTTTAEQVTGGDLLISVSVGQLDEIGALAQSFNNMLVYLRGLVTSLDQRLTERTRELDRRSAELQITAELARESTSIRDVDELMNRGVHLIRERFGYYHAGIFLLDERKEYAVLSAATGEVGRKMLAQGHRLKVGESGMVGYATSVGQPRVAMDVTRDLAHYTNPLLPETKSEAVIPLKVGERVIGALDVQSTEKNVFDDETLGVLQILADQLTIAIESGRILREMQQTVQELETVYSQYTRQKWSAVYQRLPQMRGYRYQGMEVEPISVTQSPDVAVVNAVQKGTTVVAPDEASSLYSLAVPLKLRDEVIGAVELSFEGKPPAPELITTYEEITNRLALLLENVRLLQDAQNIAAREQQINVITTQVRRSINVDAILQNTVRELGNAFGAARTFIQLGVNQGQDEDGNGRGGQ